MIRSAIFVVCFVLAPAAGLGEDNAKAAEKATEALAKAARLLTAARTAPDRVSALTETVQAYEKGLEALRGGLRSAALEERAIRRDLKKGETQTANLLNILSTSEMDPGLSVLLHPEGALSSLRAGLLASDVAPLLNARAQSLAHELEELAVLRSLQDAAIETLQSGLDGARDARTALSQAIAQRDPPGDLSATDAATLQALVSSADTLQGFAETLSSLGGSNAEDEAFLSSRGKLSPPVDGPVIEAYNPRAGIYGITIAARPYALVTAPHAATVRYAGPLLDTGMVVILEPQAGYLLIFSGLSSIFASTGEVIEPQGPLGLMHGKAERGDEFLNETLEGSGQERSERLYIELRQEKTTLDPGDWFAFSEGKD